MLDDFFARALAAGIGVALAAAPFGCFLIWRGMAFAGDAVTHSSLLGIALALALGINLPLGIAAVGCLFAVFLFAMRKRLADDSALAIGAHAALALGVILLFALREPINWEGYFFGDLLAAGESDLLSVYLICAILAVGLWLMRRPLLMTTISPDVAQIENRRLRRAELLFYLMLAVFIGIAVRIAGLLLVNALMIIPAAAARPLSRTPEGMAAMAAAIGAMSALGGLCASLYLDLPAGPAIAATACLFFAAAWLIKGIIPS